MGSIFKWDTMKEVAPHDTQYQGKSVQGKMYEVELTSGKVVRVWRSADGQHYFCHGLTFAGTECPAGAVSPYTGKPVETILREHYLLIPEYQARSGDILVWWGLAPETTPHSAVLMAPVVVPGKSHLDYTTRLKTKNGLTPVANMSLEQLIGI